MQHERSCKDKQFECSGRSNKLSALRLKPRKVFLLQSSFQNYNDSTNFLQRRHDEMYKII